VTARLTALLCSIILLSSLAPAARVSAADDPRYFPQTRQRVDDDRFWNFFLRRGGDRTFGYPVTGTFTLLGQSVQIFQRQVMQIQPDGSVGTMNLLDDELMPYTRMNGSTFPAADKNVLKDAPGVGEKDYHLRALQFTKDNAPDVFDGQPVNFYQTFMNTVRFDEAFVDGRGDRNLLPGLNLEIWGLPTSEPTYDPNNGGFIYLRFQRGIMHYDAACRCTQGLLLGQYLKSIMTLRDLPSDLDSQARGSDYYGQYKPSALGALARPKNLPNTDLTDGFAGEPAGEPLVAIDPGHSGKDPLVVIDPGHGGKEIGTSHQFADGLVLAEKDLTLKVSQKLDQRLQASGYDTVMTRTSDRGVNEPPRDLTGDDKITLADELQARVDLANTASANLFLSVHFNGVSSPEIRGTQTFFSEGRPHTDRNRALAEMVQGNLVKALAEAGYSTNDRRATTDSSVLGGKSHYYLLGPAGDPIKRASTMPAIIGEALYLTNDADANALRQERILDALAKGYTEAVKQFFSRYPVG
jgi:N-acetylmuramoyl-L-alanine amidase